MLSRVYDGKKYLLNIAEKLSEFYGAFMRDIGYAPPERDIMANMAYILFGRFPFFQGDLHLLAMKYGRRMNYLSPSKRQSQ